MRKEPRQGTYETMFNRLSEYISQYDSNWGDVIEGVSEENVKKLKEISRVNERMYDYPKEYIVYLKKMGLQDGKLLCWGFKGDVHLDYNTVVEYSNYQMEDLVNLDELEEATFLIGENTEIGIDYYVYYYSEEKYIICDEGYGGVENIISTSIENLLFQSAFKKYESYRLPYSKGITIKTTKKNQEPNFHMEHRNQYFQIILNQETDLLFELKKITQKFDMKLCWISDRVNYYFWGEKASFWLNGYGGFHGVFATCEKGLEQKFISELKKLEKFEIYEFDVTSYVK